MDYLPYFAAALEISLLAAFSIYFFKRFSKYEKEFNLLKKIGTEISAAKPATSLGELQEILYPALRAIREFTGCSMAGISLVDWEKDKAEPVAYAGPPAELEGLRQAAQGEWRNTFAGHAVLHQKSILVKRPADFPVKEREAGIRSGIFVPLMEKGNVIGLLFAGDKKENVFSKNEERGVSTASYLVAPVLRSVLKPLQEKKEGKGASGSREEMLQDLEVARIFQEKMLPMELPEVEGVEIAAKLIPAKEVAGDFYDCFLLREKTLAINIGDVSGKSVPAALLVSMARHIFRFPPSLYIRPSKLMEHANKMIYMNGGGLFISDCLATLDLARNQLVYVNAGHPPLIHYRAKDGHTAFLPATGALLGVSEESRFREEIVPLSSGDLVLFYSDGLTEIKIKGKKISGEEGLASIFQKYKELPPSRLVEELLAEILQLYEGKEQKRDDITCLVLKIL